MVCPITNTNKKHPFRIELTNTHKTTGVILCDQASMLDVYVRNAEFMEKCDEEIVNSVVDMVYSFIEI